MSVISLTDVFKGEEAHVYAPNDHPNPRGTMLMARYKSTPPEAALKSAIALQQVVVIRSALI
ncbi:hypothetical protein [Muribaculum intestinale]|nr:hypothetical protein [Muribaculum intestinale]